MSLAWNYRTTLGTSHLFKSPGVFAGYLDAAQNKGTLTDGGRVIAGDLGTISEDRYLRITGCAEDLIIRGADNIDPVVTDAFTVPYELLLTGRTRMTALQPVSRLEAV